MSAMDMQHIRSFVQENVNFFCDPIPEGIGCTIRPGALPDYYFRHPEQWELDRLRVVTLQLRRKAREAEAVATVPERRDDALTSLVRDIMAAHESGKTVEQIAADTGYVVAGVAMIIRLRGREPTDAETVANLPEPVRRVMNGNRLKGGWE